MAVPAGGSIDTDGNYLAPAQQGVYHVSATTASGNRALATVRVGPPDGFIVTPEISVQEAGTYSVKVRIKASNGNTSESLFSGDLQAGLVYPEIGFSEDQIKRDLGVDGPYTISQVILERLTEDDLLSCDQKDALGSTGAYSISEAEKPWLEIGDIQEILAEDTNSNGLIEVLIVSIPVQVVASGNYSVGAALVSTDGIELDYVQESRTWTPGSHTVSLAFDGKRIRASGKNGPYSIKGFAVRGAVEREKDFNGAIQGYDFTQFENPVQ